MSGSVPSSSSRGPANSVPRPMIIRPRTLREMMAVDTVDFISWMRPAPKSWETTTLQPMDSPAAMATDKNTMGKEEPTAATASSPTNFPTTAVSTMLYSC